MYYCKRSPERVVRLETERWYRKQITLCMIIMQGRSLGAGADCPPLLKPGREEKSGRERRGKERKKREKTKRKEGERREKERKREKEEKGKEKGRKREKRKVKGREKEDTREGNQHCFYRNINNNDINFAQKYSPNCTISV